MFWSSQITFWKITCGETNQGEDLHCGVTKVSITYNDMHYEGVPVSSYYVIAEFASVQIIFGATVGILGFRWTPRFLTWSFQALFGPSRYWIESYLWQPEAPKKVLWSTFFLGVYVYSLECASKWSLWEKLAHLLQPKNYHGNVVNGTASWPWWYFQDRSSGRLSVSYGRRHITISEVMQ